MILKFSRSVFFTGNRLKQELTEIGFVVQSIKSVGEDVWVEVGDVEDPSYAMTCIINNHQPESSGGGESGPHTHPISDVNGLTTALAGKCSINDSRLSDARTPLAHTHAIADVTGLETAIGATADALNVINAALDEQDTAISQKCDTDDPRLSDARTPLAHNHDQNYVQLNDSRLSDPRTPTAHSHAQSDVTGLVSSLASKCADNDARLSDARAPLAHSHAQSDVTGLTAALSGKQATSEKGAANGYASLDATGKVPSAELPAATSIPSGVIVMWAGLLANIPSGWLLCDGQNGTPDLRAKFIKGSAAGQNPGVTGGAVSHVHANHSNLVHSGCAVADHPAHTHGAGTIAIADHPSHTHSVTSNVTIADHASHTHTTASSTATPKLVTGNTSTGVSLVTGGPSAALSHTPTNNAVTSGAPSITLSHPVTGSTGNPSATLSHSVTQPNDHVISAHDTVNHEPPYYSLAYIQKV